MKNHKAFRLCVLASVSCIAFSAAAGQFENEGEERPLATYDNPVSWSYGNTAFEGYRRDKGDDLWDRTDGGIRMQTENQNLDVRTKFRRRQQLDRQEDRYDYQNLNDMQIDHSYAVADSFKLYSHWDLDGDFEISPAMNLSKELKINAEWNSNNEYGGRVYYRPLSDLKFKGYWDSVDDLRARMSYEPHKDWELDTEWRSENNILAGELEYKGFGRRFRPSAGLEYKSTTKSNMDKNYNQDTVWLGFESHVTKRFILETRYTLAQRDYSTPDKADDNYGRRDGRNWLNMIAEYRGEKIWLYLDYQLRYETSNSAGDPEMENAVFVWLVRE